MQPTHARWEQISPPPEGPDHSSPPTDRLDQALGEGSGALAGADPTVEDIFPIVPPVFSRTFMITDTYYSTPSSSVLGYPGPDEDVIDVGPGGLTHISEDVLAALPEDCRHALIKARSKEMAWKKSWSNENDDSARAKLRITYNV